MIEIIFLSIMAFMVIYLIVSMVAGNSNDEIDAKFAMILCIFVFILGILTGGAMIMHYRTEQQINETEQLIPDTLFMDDNQNKQ